MREGCEQLRRLGLAALFMLAASAAAAQTQNWHRPAQSRLRKSDIAQRWLATGDAGERRPRWLTPVRHRGAAEPPTPTCMPW